MSTPKIRPPVDRELALQKFWADPSRRVQARLRALAIRDDPDARRAFALGVQLGWSEKRKKAYSLACKRAAKRFAEESGE